MYFHHQFDTFEPLGGFVPSDPFSSIPAIANRARAILQGKSTERVIAIATKVSDEIESFFSDLKDEAVSKLKYELSDDQEEFLRFFEWDGGTLGNGRWFFRDGMEEELDIPTPNNCSFVDALKTIIEERDSCLGEQECRSIPVAKQWLEGSTYELFAVLSLWLLSDAIEKIGSPYSYLSIPSIVGEYLADAMHAVCHAEHLQELEWLKQHNESKRVGNTD